MAVVAKFFVSEMTKRAYNPSHVTVKMSPVVRGDQNAQWAASTPSGDITLQINNPRAAAAFDAAMQAKAECLITFDFERPDSLLDGHPYRQDNRGDLYQCGDCGCTIGSHDPDNVRSLRDAALEEGRDVPGLVSIGDGPLEGGSSKPLRDRVQGASNG
jgi:hypothetical protein